MITILCYAQKPQSRLTNQDVIDLVSLGFSDEVVIDKIHATDGAEFETSVSALRALKAAKVSDSVIRAMINAHAAVTPAPNGLVTPQKSELSKEVGVYVVLNGVIVPGGPTDQAGLKPGDVILAIGDRFLFTANELNDEIRHYKPGSRVAFRYRRYSTIYDGNLTIGKAAARP